MTILYGFSGLLFSIPQTVADILRCILYLGTLGGCPAGYTPAGPVF